MIKSMTGYGEAEYKNEWLRVSVEVKSFNAKYVDINMRLPKAFSSREIAWRNLAIAHLERGKITLSVVYECNHTGLPATSINSTLFKHHYNALQSLAEEVGASSQAIFQLAIQAPEVVTQVNQDLSDKEDYQGFEKMIRTALQQCDENRRAEGAILANKILAYLRIIEKSVNTVEALDIDRRKVLKKKLRASVMPWITTQVVDKNRLEQELIYYLERLDITEEKVRLAQHLSYFEEVMGSAHAVGKKLSFIAQEMGREINTIGSKANDVAIQKEVILMKEELEKIKEQLQNIL